MVGRLPEDSCPEIRLKIDPEILGPFREYAAELRERGQTVPGSFFNDIVDSMYFVANYLRRSDVTFKEAFLYTLEASRYVDTHPDVAFKEALPIVIGNARPQEA